jgi:thiol-disulfide isomerase/thioredoxin
MNNSLLVTTLLWLLLLAGLSCQSAYRIDAKTLPQKINQSELFLLSIDGSKISLAELYEHHRALVIFFWQSTCPCVKRYENRINKLYEKYHNKNVYFAYISSNKNESFNEVKREYIKRESKLPIYRDQAGILAPLLRAESTPTAVIINREGQMVFLGWVDNERKEGDKSRIPYLENALDDVLLNKKVSINTSPMFGCPIY